MTGTRPKSRPVVIELAGLPGAGKTSLVDRLNLQCGRRRDISLTSLPVTAAVWKAATAALALAFSIRPFRFRLLVRAASLVLMLRAYGPNARWPVIVLDQGLIQKLWSMLIESRSYSVDKLDRTVTALVPFLADHLLWVGVPPDVAARRIATRSGGNSRFDRQTPGAIAARLKSLEDTYMVLIGKFDQAAGLAVTRIDGEARLEQNVAVVESLAAASLATSTTIEASLA